MYPSLRDVFILIHYTNNQILTSTFKNFAILTSKSSAGCILNHRPVFTTLNQNYF